MTGSVRIAALMVGFSFLSGCATNIVPDSALAKLPPYAVPPEVAGRAASLKASGVAIDSIDGMRVAGNIVGNQSIKVAPGKRLVEVRYTSDARGGGNSVLVERHELNFAPNGRYEISAKLTDYTLFTSTNSLVFIDEVGATMRYLSGKGAGTVRPWTK